MSHHPHRNVDLIALRDEIAAEIKEIAASGADGATFECDIRHSQIADIESVLQLIEDRAEAQAQADAEVDYDMRRGL